MDGPSGTGKSTAARRLARECGAAYLDTGAMYRAATLAVLRAGLGAASAPADVLAVAREARIETVTDPAAPAILLDGEDVEAEIRGTEVTSMVSAVSADPALREEIVSRQRDSIAAGVSQRGGIVVEGRDIGTVVAPDAALKVFLTASDEIRAARRGAQDRKAGRIADAAVVLAAVRRRDHLDTTRAASPLAAADDAVVLDTDDLSVDAVVQELRRLLAERGMVR
jgi:cytidylate kinase